MKTLIFLIFCIFSSKYNIAQIANISSNYLNIDTINKTKSKNDFNSEYNTWIESIDGMSMDLIQELENTKKSMIDVLSDCKYLIINRLQKEITSNKFQSIHLVINNQKLYLSKYHQYKLLEHINSNEVKKIDIVFNACKNLNYANNNCEIRIILNK